MEQQNSRPPSHWRNCLAVVDVAGLSPHGGPNMRESKQSFPLELGEGAPPFVTHSRLCGLFHYV